MQRQFPDRNCGGVRLKSAATKNFRRCRMTLLGRFGLDTVDGRNPATPGMYKTLKSWDILHINWFRISAINRSKGVQFVCCFFRGKGRKHLNKCEEWRGVFFWWSARLHFWVFFLCFGQLSSCFFKSIAASFSEWTIVASLDPDPWTHDFTDIPPTFWQIWVDDFPNFPFGGIYIYIY